MTEKLKPCPFCGGEAVIKVLMGRMYICPIHKKWCKMKTDTWLISAAPIERQIKIWNRRTK